MEFASNRQKKSTELKSGLHPKKINRIYPSFFHLRLEKNDVGIKQVHDNKNCEKKKYSGIIHIIMHILNK